MDGAMRSKYEKASKPRVVLALLTQGVAGREKLSGAVSAAGGRWNLALYRSAAEFTAETVRREARGGAAGFIVGLPDARGALAALSRVAAPVVFVDVDAPARRKGAPTAFVRNDPAEIGRVAAAELLLAGPRACYGYVGWRRDEAWSVERGQAFAEALSGRDVRFFDRARCGARVDDPAAAARWLRRLPRPCALFASCDDKAWELVQICREAGLAIPGDVAILGVNDDNALCESAPVGISSVRPDFAGEGRMAVRLMDDMLAASGAAGGPGGAEPLRRTVAILGVHRRASSVRLTAATDLVARAMDWLRANALRAPAVAEAAHALAVSPSLLERRFREIRGESVYAAVLRLRLDEVKRRLRETSLPIGEITRLCGWTDPAPPKRLFKRRFGLSMRDWRAGRPRPLPPPRPRVQ